MTDLQLEDPTRTEAHREPRVAQLLLATQMVQQHLHRQWRSAQRGRGTAAADSGHAARRDPLWTRYLATPEGEAFSAWKAEALLAVQVRAAYADLWAQAWLDELADDEPPASPLEGRRVRAGRRRTLVAAYRAVLDAREAQRVDRFGIPVVQESLGADGRCVRTVVDSWSSSEHPVRWRSVRHFIDQARHDLPGPHQLPMAWAVVEPPRAPDERYPGSVNRLLQMLPSGRVADVAPAMQELLVSLPRGGPAAV